MLKKTGHVFDTKSVFVDCLVRVIKRLSQKRWVIHVAHIIAAGSLHERRHRHISDCELCLLNIVCPACCRRHGKPRPGRRRNRGSRRAGRRSVTGTLIESAITVAFPPD